jgi:ornithine cyclodeaminase
MRECIDVMAGAFLALGTGRVTMPGRTSLPVGANHETLLVMPAALRDGGVEASGRIGAWFGAKVLSIVPTNGPNGRDSHQGVVVLFDGTFGSVVAIVDAGAITALRTAAVSAVATRLLARPDAARLALIGSGVQAYSHLTAMAAVRALREVRVWSPNRSHCAALARSAEAELGIEARVGAGPRDVVEGADIICTVTSSPVPVVRSSWIQPGAHVNAVGAHRATDRELDSDTVRRARVFVDHTPSAMVEAGDILIPIAEGGVGRAHVLGDLADLVGGHVAGRLGDADVTVFKAVGVAITDIAAAAHAYERASATGVGAAVSLT